MPELQGQLWPVIVGSLAFVSTHLALSAEPIRSKLVASLGEMGFMGLYSTVSIVAFAFALYGWSLAPNVHWFTPPQWADHLPRITMPVAMVLLVTGAIGKSSTALMQGGLLNNPLEARGILRVTRHPVNSAIFLWAVTHIMTSGEAAAIMFYAAMAAVALFGSMHIDARRAQKYPEHWPSYAKTTSAIPFLAIATGRNDLMFKEIGIAKLIAGLALYLVARLSHDTLFGTSLMH